MHIIDHTRHDSSKKRTRSSKQKFRLFLIVSLLIIGLYAALMVYRFAMPVTPIKPVTKNISIKSEQPQVSWPAYGQAAIGEKSAGFLAGSPNQTPRPTASVAKVMTALAVLRKKPLKIGETGPVITLTNADVDLYNDYISKDGSVVKVVAGEEITQYQALQAMLLPSANNMADSLTRWAFGSEREYIAYANSLAMSMGMKQTTISDASGYSPLTVSTANDLLILARAALNEPVLSEIVSQPSATIPVQGKIENVNWLLGEAGVNGIKTGNTDEAGGCFMVSAQRTLQNGDTKTVIAVILGAPSRNKAINDSKPLLSSIEKNFIPITVVKKNQVVGYYTMSWSNNVQAIAAKDVTVTAWRGAKLKPIIDMTDLNIPAAAGSTIGTISVKGQLQKSDIVLATNAITPPLSWRLQRAYQL